MMQRLEINKKKYFGRLAAFWPENLMSFGINMYLGYLAITKMITLGSTQMYMRAANALQGDLGNLLDSFVKLYENYLYVTDLVWLINLKPILPNGSKKFPEKIHRSIEFRHVWFRYQDKGEWILRDINLTILAKDNLAIVGENGAGKTTLVRLLCRFYDVTKGEILIDGINIKEYDRKDLWRHMALLFQSFGNYGFNAQEAIGYGLIEEVNNLKAVSTAANKALIGDYIESLPLKYETPLDPEFDNGVRLSGGQSQRVALARMLFRNSDIMIMDEPTSNIDPKAEEEIFHTLLKEAKHKNLILISHRFSTVRLADKICVMDKGEITEYGTHEELMKKKGTYEELFTLQAKSYQ
jgi:ABC-type multidrug transport system fused ATPase/permease subunit